MKRALDLFCCAGGATKGLQRAGFHVTGVDIEPQPKYCGDNFIQANALTMNPAKIRDAYDFIWASPPCQNYSSSTKTWKAKGREYVDLIAATRALLVSTGKPFCIENVGGAPLIMPVMLCGPMFGLRVYRHRFFESSVLIYQPEHRPHTHRQVKMGRPPRDGEFVQAVGHFSGVPEAREAMDIPWMGQKELAQAIPPAYSEWIVKQIMVSK